MATRRNKVFRGLVLASLSLSIISLPPAAQPSWAQVQPTQTKTIPTELQQLFERAVDQTQQGQPLEAIATLQQALPIARAYSLKDVEGLILVGLGLNYNNVGQQQKALEYYTQALPILREVKDRSGEAATLNNIGSVYSDIGQPQKALEYLSLALPICREVKDRSGEATTLNNIGEVYSHIGQQQKALEYYSQALPILREVKDRSGEARTLANIGGVYGSIGQPQKALEYLSQALPILREVKDRSGEARTLANIGSVYQDIGQPQKALEYLSQALLIQKEVKDRSGEARTLNNIGSVYQDIGQPQKALEFYSQALPIRREVKDRSGEATTLNNIGGVYSNISQPQKALEYFSQALPIYREVNNRPGEANSLSNIGAVYGSISQPQKALEYLSLALPIYRKVNNRPGEATTLNNIGQVYSNISQSQKALEYFSQALTIHREVNNRSGEATTLANIGGVYSNIGQPQKALEYLSLALPISREVNDRSGEANTLGHLAVTYRRQGDLPKALSQINSAIDIIESIRTSLKTPDLRTSYFASVQDYYRLKIDILMQLHQQHLHQGYNIQALETSERARARTLVELLRSAQIDIRHGVDPKLLNQQQTLQQQLNALEIQRLQLLNRNASPAKLHTLDQNYNTLNEQYQQTQDQIRLSSSAYAALTQTAPQPLTLKNIQALLDDQTLLLEYSLGQEHSYLWLVSKSALTSYELPKAAEIETVARQYYSLLTDKSVLTFKQAQFQQTATKLSQLLLGPVARQLQQQRLVFVSDGALQYLPLATLPLPGRQQPLLLQHEIINLPSATTLATLRQELRQRQAAPKTLVVFADPVFAKTDPRLKQASPPTGRTPSPPTTRAALEQLALNSGARSVGFSGELPRLPNTALEAKAILKLVPAHLQQSDLGFAANLTTATSHQLADYKIIHYATHGFLDSDKPERSGLVFSLVDELGRFQNGFMRLQDIYNLKLQAELVVLSACETGLGKQIQGEGLVGLTRGFMYAGTPRVLVSLWSVNDQATAQLMSQLYQQLLGKGLTAAAALRQAQIRLMQQPEYQSPYYWAAFVLQGDWK